MKAIPFWKMESVGNNFVLIHLEDNASLIEFLPTLAVKASDRHFGIGSDGLLALRATGPNRLFLRMFNPDGTEDFCGNGLRCAIAHAIGECWFNAGDFVVDHFGKRVEGAVDDQGAFSYRFEPASYDPAAIPTVASGELFDTELLEIEGKSYRGSVLSTGTAHTLLPVSELPGDEEFFRVSPLIESHPLFPERTSVMWVMEEARSKLRLRIWERGAGETWGCGSGSAAAAIDYLRRNDLKEACVQVVNPGGVLEFRFPAWNEPGFSYGPAREVFRGRFYV
ncbi:MAG TPA: diaminopimelate epimerase [Fimbriimonadaceae bacterium]|nr:diaminopimelate epimerase [Fimbriimonadaceae bacterium]